MTKLFKKEKWFLTKEEKEVKTEPTYTQLSKRLNQARKDCVFMCNKPTELRCKSIEDSLRKEILSIDKTLKGIDETLGSYYSNGSYPKRMETYSEIPLPTRVIIFSSSYIITLIVGFLMMSNN